LGHTKPTSNKAKGDKKGGYPHIVGAKKIREAGKRGGDKKKYSESSNQEEEATE